MNCSKRYFVLLLAAFFRCNRQLCLAFSPAVPVRQHRSMVGMIHQRFKIKGGSRDSALVRYESISPRETKSEVKYDTEEIFVVFIPFVAMFLAYFQYDLTAKMFHNFVVAASGHKFNMIDGGVALDNLLKPALTGPISGLVSILFSTIVATTIAKLYERNESMTQEVGNILDDVQLLSLHASFFPSEYRKQIQASLDLFTMNFEAAWLDASTDEATRRQLVAENQLILDDMMKYLHRMNQDSGEEKNERAISEAYGTLNELIMRRSKLDNLYNLKFPSWHYGNICILGLGICIIFLFLTDKPALQFLGGFQLRVCWAMLLGCFSMLGVTIVDLITPLQGSYKIRLDARLTSQNPGYSDD
eukprot:scaffold818_cov136-Cylindrotheca_fusiformis.AAC.53